MAEAQLDAGKCLLPNCAFKKSGQLVKTKFKYQAIEKLIQCATERHESDTRLRLQSILDAQGNDASIELHKNCYCSFTSKENIRKNTIARKRKDGFADDVEVVVPAKIRRSKVKDFDLKNNFCFVQSLVKQ